MPMNLPMNLLHTIGYSLRHPPHQLFLLCCGLILVARLRSQLLQAYPCVKSSKSRLVVEEMLPLSCVSDDGISRFP
jgi:hypothetical protein